MLYISGVTVESSKITDEETELQKKNIMFFCNTPKGSLPQMRDYGLDYSSIDEPFKIFRMKATVDIVTGIRKYYGVSLEAIDITANGKGGIQIKISV